jgi:hypothetical protein
MAQITIKDASGVTQTAALISNTGQTTAANSMPVTVSAENLAIFTSIDAKLPTQVNSRTPVESKNIDGEGAVTYITNSTPVTGLNARQVVCLADTTFTTFTRTNSSGSIVGLLLPAGTLLTGPVTAITLLSGAVAAYA